MKAIKPNSGLTSSYEKVVSEVNNAAQPAMLLYSLIQFPTIIPIITTLLNPEHTVDILSVQGIINRHLKRVSLQMLALTM